MRPFCFCYINNIKKLKIKNVLTLHVLSHAVYTLYFTNVVSNEAEICYIKKILLCI